MSIAALIRRMSEAGATPEAIALAVEAIELYQAKDEERKAKQRERTAKSRARSRYSNVTVTAQSQHEGSQKNVPPHPPIENTNPPSETTSLQAPKGAARQRGTILPDDWMPKKRHYDKAAQRGQGASFVDGQASRMRNWALGNSNRAIARKADWDRTFDNWLDDALDKAAKGVPRPPERKQSAQATFLDIARQAHDNLTRNTSHDSPLDGEIVSPGSGLSATRHAHLTVYERIGEQAGEFQPEDYPGRTRTFG